MVLKKLATSKKLAKNGTHFLGLLLFTLLLFFNVVFAFADATDATSITDASDATIDVWFDIFSNSFMNSTEVLELKNNKKAAQINYAALETAWLPNIALDFPANVVAKRGDSIYSKGQSPSSDYSSIVGANANVSVYQKLPGNGYIQSDLGYGLEYYLNRNQFLQNPYLTVTFFQPISAQMFNIWNDSYTHLAKTQSENEELVFYQGMFEHLVTLLDKIQNYEKLLAEKDYYEALIAYNEEKTKAANEKLKQGMGTRLESYYAEQQVISAKRQLAQVNYNISDVEKNLLLVMNENTNLVDLIKKVNENRIGLLAIFEYDDERVASKTLLQEYYDNLIVQNKWQYKNDKLSNAPQFYAKASVSPDKSLYYMYSDWEHSWKELFSSPNPFQVSLTLGFRLNFDTIGKNLTKRKIYLLTEQTINSAIEMTAQKQNTEKQIIQKELLNLEYYWLEISTLISTEQKFRSEKQLLLTEGLITEEEFLQSEILFAELKRSNIDTFWQIINKRLTMFYLTQSVPGLIEKIEKYQQPSKRSARK